MISEKEISKHLKGDRVIWIIVLFMALISIAAVYSSSSSLAFRENKSTISFLFKQMKFVSFGLMALYCCYKLPLKLYRVTAYFGLILAIFLLIVTLIKGAKINEAGRWLNLMGFMFQPAEIAKVAVIVYLAKILEIKKLDTFNEFVKYIIVPIGLAVTLVLYGSISTGLLISAVTFLILIVNGVKWSHLFKSAGIVLVGISFIILLNLSFNLFPRIDTAVSRIKHFTTTSEKSENLTDTEKRALLDKTFQADMAKVAISSVGVTGKGPGKSTQRYLLPHPYSDFIYAIIIEEWGFLGGFFVLMLYIIFFTRCMAIAKSCSTTFTFTLVMGIAILITAQAMLHICVNVGLIPVTGHTLPLISLGGTSLIIISGSFGIILSVSRTLAEKNIEEDLEETNKIIEEDNIEEKETNIVKEQQILEV